MIWLTSDRAIARANSLQSDLVSSQSDAAALQSKLDSAHEVNASLRVSLTTIQATLKSVEAEKHQLTRDLETRQQEIVVLQQKLSELKLVTQEQAKTNEQRASHEAALADLKQQIVMLQSQAKQAEVKNDTHTHTHTLSLSLSHALVFAFVSHYAGLHLVSQLKIAARQQPSIRSIQR